MPTIITPERFSFLLMFISLAIFTRTQRYRRGFHVGWLTAVLYALLEILAQLALFGGVFYAVLFLITSFSASRLSLFLGLFITVLIVIVPARKVTQSIEAYLGGSYGAREKKQT